MALRHEGKDDNVRFGDHFINLNSKRCFQLYLLISFFLFLLTKVEMENAWDPRV